MIGSFNHKGKLMTLLNEMEKLNQRLAEPQAFSLIRQMGRKEFEKLGWPTKKWESWRYSPAHKLQLAFKPQLDLHTKVNSAVSSLDTTNASTSSTLPSILMGTITENEIQSIIAKWSHPEMAVLMTVNGHIVKMDPSLKDSIQTLSLPQAFMQGKIDSSHFNYLGNSLDSLNLSFFDRGQWIKVVQSVPESKPIHWIQCFSSDDLNPLFQERFYWHLTENTHCTVLMTPVILKPNGSASAPNSSQKLNSKSSTIPDSSTATDSSTVDLKSDHSNSIYWSNSILHIQLDPHSNLHWIDWKELHQESQFTQRNIIKLSDGTLLHLLQGGLASGWSRSETFISVKGVQNKISLHTVCGTLDEGIADQQTSIQFIGTDNQAEQICKNLLLGSSRAIFNGHIEIQTTAQKTDSSQLHQSLLLSPKAEVDTKPQLEIFADDVKATHGAAIGQLNPDEIFYMQSRGISYERAKSILCVAFLLDLTERLSSPILRDYLKRSLNQINAQFEFKNQTEDATGDLI